jgi:hypothetical protein
MKKIKIQGSRKYIVVDDRDFNKLSKLKWKLDNYGYPTVVSGKYSGKQIQLVIKGKREGYQIDHKNRDTLDNRRSNLRYATYTENQLNTVSRGGASKHKGVSVDNRIDKNKWRMKFKLTIPGTTKPTDFELSGLRTEHEAAIVYNIVASHLCKKHGIRLEFLRLNQVTKKYVKEFQKNDDIIDRLKKTFGISQRFINKFIK